MPGTYSDNELTKNDATICHLRMLSVCPRPLHEHRESECVCASVSAWRKAACNFKEAV